MAGKAPAIRAGQSSRQQEQTPSMQDAQFQATQQDVEQSIADFTAAARDVRAFFFGFLSIAAYIAVIVAGTTDLQLVRVDPVTLPLVNVEVPILGFYVLVPLLLLVLHVHLLLQFHHLARRQQVVQGEIDALRPSIGADDAAALYRRFIIFPLVQWLRPAAGRQLRERFAYGAIGWLTPVFFPLFLLVWIQLRFAVRAR
jgi:hypothetical protein